jgi:hypothetical protein
MLMYLRDGTLGREGRSVVRLDDQQGFVFPDKAHQGPAGGLGVLHLCG